MQKVQKLSLIILHYMHAQSAHKGDTGLEISVVNHIVVIAIGLSFHALFQISSFTMFVSPNCCVKEG